MEFDLIAITGIGVISPIGCGQKQFTDSLKKGTVGLSKIVRMPQERPLQGDAFQVLNFEPPKYASIRGSGVGRPNWRYARRSR